MIKITLLKKKIGKCFINQESGRMDKKSGIFSFHTFCFEVKALWSVLSSSDSILPC
jgi:hypothetical protein